MKLATANNPFARIEGVFCFMPTEIYDEMQWEIEDMPIGFSTPDDLFELSYRAYTQCHLCGEEITGTANYWSREDGIGGWLNSIDYTPCECEEHQDEEDEEEDF